MLNPTDYQTTKLHLERKLELLNTMRAAFADSGTVAKFHNLRKQYNMSYEILFDNFIYAADTPAYAHYKAVLASLDQSSRPIISTITLINKVFSTKKQEMRNAFIALIDAQIDKFTQQLAELRDPNLEEKVVQPIGCSITMNRNLIKVVCGIIGVVLVVIIAPAVLASSKLLAMAIALTGLLIILSGLCGLIDRLFSVHNSQEKADDAIETITFNKHPSAHNYHSIFHSEAEANQNETTQTSTCFERLIQCKWF